MATGHARFPLTAALLAAIAALCPASYAGEGGGTVSISGVVVDSATGAPVKDAEVSTLGEVARTDESGAFTLGGVESSREARVNFRVVDDFGSVIGCSSIELPVNLVPVGAALGTRSTVAVVRTEGDVKGLRLELKERTGADQVETCSGCHNPNPCVAKPEEGGDWRSVTHLRGLEVKERDIEETRAKIREEGMRPDLYSTLRYQDAHPQNVNVAKRVEEEEGSKQPQYRMPDRLTLADDGRMTCDTCHTRHIATENGVFLKLDSMGQPLLCRQCHL